MCSDVFAREVAGTEALRSLPFDSCIRGALGADELLETMARNAFEVEVWEDHSQSLRSFAAQVVWRGGSMRNFWCQAGGVGDPSAVEAAMAVARPGYYVMIARPRPWMAANGQKPSADPGGQW